MTSNRNEYEEMRDKSNAEFKKASYCGMVVLANHLISALDAAWTIRGINRQVESKVRIGLKPVQHDLTPFLSVNFGF